MVLIDPPYEVKGDYRRVEQVLLEALRHFATGTYLGPREIPAGHYHPRVKGDMEMITALVEAMETAAEKFLRFGMVPAEMQPADGLRRVEVVDEGEDEVEEIQGGPRPLMTPDVD